MSMLDTMTQDEITDYIMSHEDEFKVVRVESKLVSLISRNNFKKCFVLAAKRFFKNGVTDLSSAKQALRLVGFDLEIRPITGKAYMRGRLETSVAFLAWMPIMVGVVSLLFEGSITMTLRHNLTGEEISITHNPSALEHLRRSYGITSDLPIEPQLLKLFDIS